MRPKEISFITFFIFVAILGAIPSVAGDFGVVRIGDSHRHLLPEDEREHLRARDLRERSEGRSGAHLGYPDVFQDSPDRTIDYYLLSHQIARLKELIEALESQKPNTLNGNPEFIPQRPPGLSLTPSLGQPSEEMSAIYGAEGPNAKSVRLLLEYNLMIAGNPRLKIGRIEEGGESILAEIVTLEGSLVEKYSIDRKTGLWKVIR